MAQTQLPVSVIQDIVRDGLGGDPDTSFEGRIHFLRCTFYFNGHPLIGRDFLRLLGFLDRRAYTAFLTRYFPERKAEQMLVANGFKGRSRRSLSQRISLGHRAIGSTVQEEQNTPAYYANRRWLSEAEVPSGLLKYVVDEESISPFEERLYRYQCRSRLSALLLRIPPREREVIQEFYGFLDGEPRTQKAIGDVRGLSHTRVQQLLERGLNHLFCLMSKEGLV